MRAVFVVPLAVILCAGRVVAATSGDIRVGQTSLRVVMHGPFRITSAYFADAQPWIAPGPSGVLSRNDRFCGSAQSLPNTTAAPGVLSFCSPSAFASCPTGFGQSAIQNLRLTKEEA